MRSDSVSKPVDERLIIYRIVKWLALAVAAAYLIKFFFFDTFLIATDQMKPTLLEGDRVLIFRLCSVWPLSDVCTAGRKAPVIVENRRLFDTPVCLRVAAKSGDSVCVSGGKLSVVNLPAIAFASKASSEDLLTPNYSPRDSMPLYVLPRKGSTVFLDSLRGRDFFFAASLIRQENPRRLFVVKPSLLVNDSNAAAYRLSDFYLYKGSLDSVPPQRQFDFFFWDRVRDYCAGQFEDSEVSLSFSLLINGAAMHRYAFSKSCIFLCADDWQKGYDSRYFGPVLSSCVKGRVLCVLWSIGKDADGKRHFRWGRLFKIIR